MAFYWQAGVWAHSGWSTERWALIWSMGLNGVSHTPLGDDIQVVNLVTDAFWFSYFCNLWLEHPSRCQIVTLDYVNRVLWNGWSQSLSLLCNAHYVQEHEVTHIQYYFWNHLGIRLAEGLSGNMILSWGNESTSSLPGYWQVPLSCSSENKGLHSSPSCPLPVNLLLFLHVIHNLCYVRSAWALPPEFCDMFLYKEHPR